MIIFNDLIIAQIDLYKVIVSILGLTIAFFLVIRYFKKEKEIMYYWGYPENLPMAIIQYYDQGKFNNKTIWLTILDLIQKGFYELKPVNCDEYKIVWKKEDLFNLEKYKLRYYEEYLVKYINSFIVKNRGSDKSVLLNDLINEMKADVQLPERIKTIYSNIMYEIENSYGKLSYFTNYIIAFILLILYFWL